MPRHTGQAVVDSIGNIPELVVNRIIPAVSLPYAGEQTGRLEDSVAGANLALITRPISPLATD